MKKIMPVWFFTLLSLGYVMGEPAFNDVVVNFEPPESQPSSIRSFVLYESGSARIQSQEKFEGNQSLEMKGPSAIGIELVNPAEIYQFSFQCKINSLDEEGHTGLDFEILDSLGLYRLTTRIMFSNDIPRNRFFEIRIELFDYHAYQVFIDGKPQGSEKALNGSNELELSKLILRSMGGSDVIVDDIHILTKAGYKDLDGLYEARGVLVGFPNGEGTFESEKIPSVLMESPHELIPGAQGVDLNTDSDQDESIEDIQMAALRGYFGGMFYLSALTGPMSDTSAKKSVQYSANDKVVQKLYGDDNDNKFIGITKGVDISKTQVKSFEGNGKDFETYEKVTPKGGGWDPSFAGADLGGMKDLNDSTTLGGPVLATYGTLASSDPKDAVQQFSKADLDAMGFVGGLNISPSFKNEPQEVTLAPFTVEYIEPTIEYLDVPDLGNSGALGGVNSGGMFYGSMVSSGEDEDDEAPVYLTQQGGNGIDNSEFNDHTTLSSEWLTLGGVNSSGMMYGTIASSEDSGEDDESPVFLTKQTELPNGLGSPESDGLMEGQSTVASLWEYTPEGGYYSMDKPDNKTDQESQKGFLIPDFKHFLIERLGDSEKKDYSLINFNFFTSAELYLNRRNQMLELDVQMSKQYSPVEKNREVLSTPVFDQNLRKSVSMLDEDERTQRSSSSQRRRRYSTDSTTREVAVPSGHEISSSSSHELNHTNEHAGGR